MKLLDLTRNTNALNELDRRRQDRGKDLESKVRPIIAVVRDRGDSGLMEFTRQFDCEEIHEIGLRVKPAEIDRAYKEVSGAFLKAIRLARRNILGFHRRQLPKSWTMKSRGLEARQRFLPLERAGIYVPGGKAAYPSTVLMNALPASVAGVREIAMATPPDREGRIAPPVLVAAREAGVTEIYRMGGAQAIAAFAYGTESVKKVDMITGPGNEYVATAKRLVFGDVGVDAVAGPTEVVVIVDGRARPEFVAADLIAQAEHDEQAVPICISPSDRMLARVRAEVARQLESAPRKEIASRALEQNGLLILAGSLDQAAEIANRIAPEHCEIMTRQPRRLAAKIRTAGAIFIGEWATEALGDYIAGPNHTLPTSGTARFSSALSVMDFMRFTTLLECSRKRFRSLGPHVEVLAEAEGLYGHAASVRVRRDSDA